MTPTDILRHRIAHQQLGASRFREPADLVAWFGAMQAQEYAMVKWALALRLPVTTETALEHAFNEGHLLRTHVLRPTWHVVAPQDIRWLLALTAPRVHAACAFGRKQFSLTPPLLRRADAIIVKALAGGRHLTREEIAPALKRARLPTAGIPLAHLFIHAELGGLICSGPRRGKQFTYALLDERVPATPVRSREEALAELTRRYFTSRSPATAQDFAWWSGLTLTEARAGIATLARGFSSEKIGGQTYIRPEPAKGARLPALPSFLMPDYDEYGIAYEDRAALFADHALTGKFRETAHAYNRMVIVDGRIVGSWKRTEKGPVVDLEVVPLSALTTAAKKKIEQAAHRYAAYLGKSLALRLLAPREASSS